MNETIYEVVVSEPSSWSNCRYQELYGHETNLFRTREAAEARATELNTTGYWGDERPEYEVQEIDLETARERLYYDQYGIAE